MKNEDNTVGFLLCVCIKIYKVDNATVFILSYTKFILKYIIGPFGKRQWSD